MITAVMLHWARPTNVQRIAAGWVKHPLITESVVFSNGQVLPTLPEEITKVHVDRDLGLRSRFIAALTASNDALLIQDDDIELPAETIHQLWTHWQQAPAQLHGLFGRRPQANGNYAIFVDRQNAEAEVLLTRALMTHRDHAARFFLHERDFPALNRGQPRGNGEDIVFSYLAMAYSRKINKVYDLAAVELPAPESIHLRVAEHWNYRTRVMRQAAEWHRQFIATN